VLVTCTVLQYDDLLPGPVLPEGKVMHDVSLFAWLYIFQQKSITDCPTSGTTSGQLLWGFLHCTDGPKRTEQLALLQACLGETA
jgi:hypothetical protein